MMDFSQEEKQRYSRHLNLPDFDLETQAKLKAARVLMVGAGGLGGPVLQYLVAAGVGKIGIIDPDVIALSNLQRQILYNTDQIGERKVDIASDHLTSLNPNVDIHTYRDALTNDNALELISEYDIVVDGTDNFPTRYLVNDACVISDKINVYASIYRYEGQVAVFNGRRVDGTRGPHYRHLFPEPPKDGLVPDCATGGVLGVLAGIVGTMQALEVIKLITGIGQPLIGKVLIYDALASTIRTFRISGDKKIEISQLENYDDFCGVNRTSEQQDQMKEITVQELKQWQDEGKDFQLIDVREQHELDVASIPGHVHIPLGDIMSRSEEVAEDIAVVMMCRSGQRSAAALMALQSQGKENIFNLKGGINAWATEIDTSLSTY